MLSRAFCISPRNRWNWAAATRARWSSRNRRSLISVSISPAMFAFRRGSPWFAWFNSSAFLYTRTGARPVSIALLRWATALGRSPRPRSHSAAISSTSTSVTNVPPGALNSISMCCRALMCLPLLTYTSASCRRSSVWAGKARRNPSTPAAARSAASGSA